MVLWNLASLAVSEIVNGECNAMVDMTLNDLGTNVKVIHLNDFLAVNSNFCSRTHRLATIHMSQTTATTDATLA